MKKLIVLSLVFALVASAAFAMDVTGTVFGHVNVIEGSTEKDSKITSSGSLDRVRLDGSFGDEGFGGYIRLQGSDAPGVDSANAWWKPIDQLKIIIGSNSDGFWGKEGVTGWGFNQMPNDSGIAVNPGIWYGEGWGSSIYGYYGLDYSKTPPEPTVGVVPFMHNRYTFFEGAIDNSLLLEITPMDMLAINIAIPFIRDGGYETADVFKNSIAQVSLNFDFGNIAITYDGGGRAVRGIASDWGDVPGRKYASDGAIYAYFGGSFGDLGLDVGFSYHLTGEASDDALPIGIGVGVKYATDTFGIKFRTTAALAGDDKGTYINASLLPYYNINDSISAFLNAGLGMIMPDVGDAVVGWYANPYLRVGAEWGPTFYVGIQVWSNGLNYTNGKPDIDGSDTIINFAVPLSLMVSF